MKDETALGVFLLLVIPIALFIAIVLMNLP